MPRTYLCCLHKSGVMAPNMRTFVCEDDERLADKILGELRSWGNFERIDVYDDNDQRMCSFTRDGNGLRES